MSDIFVRPYVGDFLVVILLYCLIMGVVEARKVNIALSVLVFSYVLETLQYFRVVEVLRLDKYALANIVIGTSFEWIDIIAYTLGILTVLYLEGEI